MINNVEEEEIKIEYFETYDEDPLSQNVRENRNNKIDRCNISFNNKDELKVNETISDYVEVDSDEVSVSYENWDPVEQENTGKWHKAVDDSNKYVCKFCDLSYSTVQTLRYHIKLKHTENYHEIKNTTLNKIQQRKAKCHICNMKFKNITELKVHSQNHSLTDKENICVICYATFKEYNELLNHMTVKHELKKRKLHICTTCGYNTSKLYHFRQHMNTHTNENIVKCSYCTYTSNRSTNLKIHVQIHLKNKLYMCEFKDCGYRCITAAALRSHRLIHDKGKYMLYCDKCSYSTVYKQSLDKHLDSHRRNKVRNRM